LGGYHFYSAGYFLNGPIFVARENACFYFSTDSLDILANDWYHDAALRKKPAVKKVRNLQFINTFLNIPVTNVFQFGICS